MQLLGLPIIADQHLRTERQSSQQAPVAARRDHDVSIHGDHRIDPYFWLRERDDPEVIAHLRAENAHAQAWFLPLTEFQSALYAEMLARIQEDDETVPYRKGAWWYFTRTKTGQAYPVHARRFGSAEGPEQVLLDLNELAIGKPFLQAGTLTVSPDAALLAYTLDESGSLDFRLHVKRIDDGHVLPLSVDNVRGAVWAQDSRSLFVLTHDDARRACRVWRHDVDTAGPGLLVYEDADERFWVGLDKTLDGQWIIIHSDSADTTELRVIAAAKPNSRQRIVVPRRKGREATLEHRNKHFYVLVNDTGPNFRLITTPSGRPNIEQAEELVAHRSDVLLEDLDVFAHHVVLTERTAGMQTLCVIDCNSGQSHSVGFDETVYSTYTQCNAEFESVTLRLSFQSLTTPESVVDYDMVHHRRTLRKQQAVLGGYDRQNYAAQQVWACAPDGQRVPVSLVWRRDLRTPGTPQPLLLEGYGAYGISNDVFFSSSRLSLLDRGVIVGLAHVRGGCDMGRTWYLDGKLGRKMNTFTDFIACAEALIAQRWTQADSLIIEGGSAGGLLVGAVTNMRPELFKAVVADVPFVDVINTMLDDSLPLTTGEYLEWGNPHKKADYRIMRSYSPYDNLRAQAYPAVYLRTSLNDSQVPYWEAAKYAARLREVSSSGQPVILSINLDAGHGGASGRYDALKERAEVLSFMLAQWGLAEDSKRDRCSNLRA